MELRPVKRILLALAVSFFSFAILLTILLFANGRIRFLGDENLHFKSMGDVLEVRLMKDKDTGENRGYAFVSFKTKEVAQMAIEDIHNKEFKDPSERPKGHKGEEMNENFQLWSFYGESCPEGTIPIRRTTEQDMLRASSVSKFGRKLMSSLEEIQLVMDMSWLWQEGVCKWCCSVLPQSTGLTLPPFVMLKHLELG